MSKFFNIDDRHDRLAAKLKLGYEFEAAFTGSMANQIVGEGKCYVYFLIDPRDKSVFYVGKGKGKRVKDHVKNAKNGRVDNALKHRRIMQITDAGSPVIEQVFFRTDNEAQSLFVEKFFIKELKNYGLTNIVNGSSSNAERIIEEVEAVRRGIPPLNWLTERNDPDMISVFGSMAGYHEFAHRVLDEVVAECREKIGVQLESNT